MTKKRRWNLLTYRNEFSEILWQEMTFFVIFGTIIQHHFNKFDYSFHWTSHSQEVGMRFLSKRILQSLHVTSKQKDIKINYTRRERMKLFIVSIISTETPCLLFTSRANWTNPFTSRWISMELKNLVRIH